jgi:hypothetical protein
MDGWEVEEGRKRVPHGFPPHPLIHLKVLLKNPHLSFFIKKKPSNVFKVNLRERKVAVVLSY